MGTAVAVGGAVLGAGASIYGAKKQAKAAKSAAGKAEDFAREQWEYQKETMAPWMETGKEFLELLSEKVKAGPGEFTESPGYAFRLAEGEKAIQRAAAARGLWDSGPTMKALTRYGQDYATADYDQFLNRYYQSLNPLSSLAQVGQQAVGQAVPAAGAYGQQMGNLAMQRGAATASSYGSMAGAVQGGMRDIMQTYLLKDLFGKQN